MDACQFRQLPEQDYFVYVDGDEEVGVVGEAVDVLDALITHSFIITSIMQIRRILRMRNKQIVLPLHRK